MPGATAPGSVVALTNERSLVGKGPKVPIGIRWQFLMTAARIQPLTAPMVKPEMKRSRKALKSRAMGIATSITAA